MKLTDTEEVEIWMKVMSSHSVLKIEKLVGGQVK